MGGLLKLTISSVAVIVVACVAAVFLVPASTPARAARRNAQTREFLGQVAGAVWAYHREKGEFPPGDGEGSAGLMRSLRGLSREGIPFLCLHEGMLNSAGDLRNPLAPETSIVYYRRLKTDTDLDNPFPARCSFDLWCRSPEGVEIGVTDWAPVVSPP